jgi:Glycosyl hydrolases family 31/Domain of unknown function (DUF4968)
MSVGAGARCAPPDFIRAILILLILSRSVGIAAQMPGQEAPGPPPAQVEQTSHGIRATAGREVLEVTVCSDSVIHVVATPEPSAPASPRPWMLDAQQSCPGAPFTFAQDAKVASLKTAQLEIIVNIERDNLTFRTTGGESLLNEGSSIPRTYEPVELNGDHTYRVTDRFSPSITEALYELGLLTRSAFLGQQRVGATVWSGDVYGTYWGLSHQVPAGLNFALSGHPYWTTDIGGYWPPHDDPLADPAFQELYARWFEYGTFCPIFRTHGHRPHNELWSYDRVEPILVSYDKLRYRLMPYICSLALKVTSEDYTIQRPLVMDWRTDPNTWNLGDEFMFGPAILVNPILKANATKRRVYLPAAPAWYDFWSGQSRSAGELEADAPLDRMPLYVRAGSIIPMGPAIEYATQDPGGPSSCASIAAPMESLIFMKMVPTATTMRKASTL